MRWERVSLGDVVTFRGGGTPRKDVPEYWGPDVPWATVKDFKSLTISTTADSISEIGLASSAANLIPAGHVIIPTRMALGKAAINAIDLAINQDLRALIPRVEVDPVYLLHSILGLAKIIERHGSGATVKGITQDKLAALQIPLPPLEEQKRIAAILNAADALRAKRRQTLAELDTLLQSTFLDMFGDPVTNPKGWEVKALKDGVESFEGGRNLMPIERERRDRIRVLKVSAVTSGEYRPDESKPFSQNEPIQESHMVRNGDLLISRANTADLVGAVVYVWNTEGREMLPDKLWRFVLSDPRIIEPLFLLHVARSDYFRRQLIQRATGTSGSMKNIGKTKMLSIQVPFPPLSLQRHFATIVESVEQQKARLRAHLTELDTLFASLQSRAFKGEL
ncbi:MAG: restriction endonuclease subunit S [Spirochaetaceae bacterium]|nr:MAG: restriction endonuclease subunit S [Spirochaetaceae bacterium]